MDLDQNINIYFFWLFDILFSPSLNMYINFL